MILAAGCLGCLGWLLAAVGGAVVVGRAVRLADRWSAEWGDTTRAPDSPTPGISRV